MFSLHISTMLGWFDAIASWFSAIISAIGGFLILQVYAGYAAIAFICDLFQSIFRQLAGLGEQVDFGLGRDTTGDILTDFLNNSQVKIIFRNLMLVAIVLLLVFMVFAILKAEYNQDGKTTKMSIVGKAVKALFTFFLVPALTIGGIYISNQLLKTLDRATTVAQTSSISATVFMAAAYNANRALVEYDADGNAHYVDEYFYNRISSTTANQYNLGYFGSNFQAAGLNKDASIAEQINYAVIHGVPKDSFTITEIQPNLLEEPTTYFMSVNSINESMFNYLNPFVIGTYYRAADINYIILYAGMITAFYMMCVTILGLIKRIFTIAMLYVVSPPIVAMMPLDNGSAFNKWKGEMIGQVLGAYGAVVGMNLVFLFMSASQSLNFSITLFGIANYNSVVVTYVMRLLFILVALSMAVKLPGIVSGFIGAKDSYGSGKEIAGDVVKTAAKGAAVLTGVGGVAFKGLSSAAGKVGNALTTKKVRGADGKVLKDEDGKPIRENNKFGDLLDNAQEKISESKFVKGVKSVGGKVGGVAKKVGGAIKNSTFGDVFSDTFGASFMASAGGKEIMKAIKGDKDTPSLAKRFKEAANIDGGTRVEAANDYAAYRTKQLNESKAAISADADAKIQANELRINQIKADNLSADESDLSDDEKAAYKADNQKKIDALEADNTSIANKKAMAIQSVDEEIAGVDKTSKSITKKDGYTYHLSKDEQSFVDKAAAWKKNEETQKDIASNVIDNMAAANVIPTADGALLTELKEAIKMAIKESGGDASKLGDILGKYQSNGTLKFDKNQLDQFVNTFNDSIAATEAQTEQLKRKGQSNDEKLIDAIKEMHKDLSDKLKNIDKK